MIKVKIDTTTQKSLRRKLAKTKGYSEKEFYFQIQQTLAEASAKAKQRAPIDTGNLRRSIGYDFKNKSTAIYRALAEYASYVEYGTMRRKAKPFFERSLNEALKRLERRIKAFLKKNWK